jgi:competence protein ComEC
MVASWQWRGRSAIITRRQAFQAHGKTAGMRSFVLAFAAGIWYLQQQSYLPAPTLLAVIGAVALLCLCPGRGGAKVGAGGTAIICPAHADDRRRRPRFPLGGGICPLAHGRGTSGRLEGRTSKCAAWSPACRRNWNAACASVSMSRRPCPGCRQISLAWYRGADSDADESPHVPVRAGERWRFTVRLKRPHGNLNPHGFDYEAWLFERGIRATGYVRPRPPPSGSWRGSGSPGYAVEMLREAIRDRFRTVLPEAPYAGILVALVIGDQQAIAPDLWQAFARTGITHLMSISGLHVTMLAGLAYALVNWLWRRSPRLPLRLPAQQAAALGGLLAAFGYCLLAGFAVPAQRTLYMLGVVALAHLAARELSASRVLALALLLVLLLDPWAVLAAGFWLSFGAVGLLFLILGGRLGPAHWLQEWLRAQWAVTSGMLPALLMLFQQFSLVSPLANAWRFPLVSFVITPLALLGSLPLLDPVLVLGTYLHHGVDDGRRLAGGAAAGGLAAGGPAAVGGAAGAGRRRLDAVAARLSFALAGAAVLPAAADVEAPRPLAGTAAITVLDVGQGLAIHVQTARHDLLFDAGPAFSADADSGNRIIAPYLRAMGVRRLDAMVISHADKDHEGGAASVLAALPVALLKTSLPFEHPLSAQPVRHELCVDGDAWEWDGVRFEMLHPGQRAAVAQVQRPELRAARRQRRQGHAADARTSRPSPSRRCWSLRPAAGGRCDDGAAPWQPHLVDPGIRRRGRRPRCDFPGGLSQPLWPSEGRGGGALCRQRRAPAPQRP